MKDDPSIRFLGITGVTRLKDVSIFSAGSDINDLSYYKPVSTIAGFTREEIRKYYTDYIDLAVSLEKGKPQEQVTESERDELLDRLSEEYDGYCFTGMTTAACLQYSQSILKHIASGLRTMLGILMSGSVISGTPPPCLT